MSGRPLRAGCACIYPHIAVLAVNRPLRHFINIRQGNPGTAGDSARAVGFLPVPGDFPLAVTAEFQVHDRRGTVAHGKIFILARQHQLDRLAGYFCQPRADRTLHPDRELAAETAAHVLADCLHLVLVQLEQLCEIVPGTVNRLGGNPHFQLVILPLRYSTVSFKSIVYLDLGADRLLSSVRRRSKNLLDLFLVPVAIPSDIALFADTGCVLFHRVFLCHHIRQLIVFHPDQPEGFLSRVRADCSHCSDLLTLIAHRVFLQVQHCLDPGVLFRSAEIDVFHVGMRVGAAQDSAVEHARQNNILSVLGRSVDLFRPVGARHVFRDISHLF